MKANILLSLFLGTLPCGAAAKDGQRVESSVRKDQLDVQWGTLAARGLLMMPHWMRTWRNNNASSAAPLNPWMPVNGSIGSGLSGCKNSRHQ